MGMMFDLAVKSLPWTVAHMFFFWCIGIIAGVNLGSLAFSAGGFVIFYITTYSYLRSLRPN